MKVVTGFILGWVVLAVAALLLVYSGVYDVAASKPENAITAWLFSTTMRLCGTPRRCGGRTRAID